MNLKFNPANTINGIYQNGDSTKTQRSGTGEPKKWMGDREGKVVAPEKQPVKKVYHKNPQTGKVEEYPSKTYMEDKSKKPAPKTPEPKKPEPKKQNRASYSATFR